MRAFAATCRVLCVCIAIPLASVVRADDRLAEFSKGNAAYAEEHFAEAIQNYERAVSARTWSPALFYNLGNAYFRAGDAGHAILNYRRALVLDPHHPEAEANLRVARDRARALDLRPDALESYAAWASADTYAIIGALAFWMVAFLLVNTFRRQRRATTVRMSVLTAGVLILVASLSALYLFKTGRSGRALGIVTGHEVQARVATAENASSVLPLPPGSEVKVLSRRGDWLYALLPNDSRGWIPSRAVELVRL
ncbi:MAG: tetratricopeptide repeat protein [Chthoniobacterales bacterium]